MKTYFAVLALIALGACTTQVPDSGKGVGFESPAEFAKRQAALEGSGRIAQRSEPIVPVDANGVPLAPGATTATAAASDGSVDASPSNPAPTQVRNTAGISDEQNFDAVAERESIESDAARRAANKENFVIIEPGALPTRPGARGPNIVDYALATNNPVGTQIYPRRGFNLAQKNLRNCAAYASPDLAQEDFLARGGPKRDRLALDPDGDGFACRWNPGPFRAVANR